MGNNTWSKEYKEAYNMGLSNVSDYMDKVDNYSAFDGSTALAIVFKLSKEETLEDLIEIRK